jgi:hypothetical protein
VQIDDRSLVWNTDLIETLELQNCLDNAMITMCAPPFPVLISSTQRIISHNVPQNKYEYLVAVQHPPVKLS